MTTSFNALAGYRIVTNDLPINQIQNRFSRSKRRRIRKKWRKKPENWKPVFIKGFLVIPQQRVAICTTETARELKQKLNLNERS